MKISRNRKGFTLLEILIVIVILGVVAGLAVPVFTSNIDKSKAQEAMASLAAVRSAMTTYYATNGSSYANAALAPGNGFIGYNPASSAAGQVLNFSYSFTAAPAAATYSITASCTTCGSAGSIVIDETGAVVRSGSMS